MKRRAARLLIIPLVIVKYFCLPLLFIAATSLAQIDLGRNKPVISPDILTSGPFMRMRDLAMNRDAAGEANMDWARWKQWQQVKESAKNGVRNASWENFGPHGTSGRMISIAFHPTDSNIIYAGSASGGLWKTEDYGATWQCLTDNYPTMGIGAVAINPENPNTLLIATGEGYYFGSEFTSGFGILISHDAGATWNLTNVTAELVEGFAGMDICWNWNDTTQVCAATSYGVFFSSDGGSNFSYTLDRMPARMLQDPQNPDALYLAARYYTDDYPGGFYRSYDSGESWNMVSGSGLPSPHDMGYASLAVHPVFNNIIYANVSQSPVNGLGPMEGLFKSNDFGNTFIQIPTSIDIQCYQPPYDDVCQGWFANTIAISPADTNTLFAGGTRLWKSTDGGYNWFDGDILGFNYAVHPDHHQTLFHPLTGDLFDCNDGGVDYSSDFAQNWTSVSAGLITHQFYTLVSAETDPEVVIGGAQDVGLFSSLESLSTMEWDQEFSGDAFGCAIDYTDENIWYGAMYFNEQRVKTNTAGDIWFSINDGTNDADQWRMPMVMHPSDNSILFSSGDGNIFKTTDGGNFWNAVSAPGEIGCIEFDKVNPDIVYASELFGGTVYRSTDGGNQWVQLPSSPGSPITDLAADPMHSGVVYAAVGSFGNEQVFKSTDLGAQWLNISYNLPAVPVNTIAIDPNDYTNIYAGTDLGVWASEDGGFSWSSFNDGLPVVVVDDIHFYAPDSSIRIGTYGRGYWRSPALPSSLPIGVQEPLSPESDLTVFPNPARDYLYIQFTGR